MINDIGERIKKWFIFNFCPDLKNHYILKYYKVDLSKMEPIDKYNGLIENSFWIKYRVLVHSYDTQGNHTLRFINGGYLTVIKLDNGVCIQGYKYPIKNIGISDITMW